MEHTIEKSRWWWFWRSMQTPREGFSLMEILIAVLIMGIIAAVIVPNFMGYLQRAKVRGAKTTLRSFEQAITIYYTDIGKYPTSPKDLIKAPADEKMRQKWQGPYLHNVTEVPEDPWGSRYQYRVTPGGEHPYELYSYGPNGKGAPKKEWISVWDKK